MTAQHKKCQNFGFIIFKNQRAAQIFVTKPAKESTNILA